MLIWAQLYFLEDSLVYSSSSLRQWSVRNFQGWFIQLPLSRHQAPGILPVLCSPHNPSVFQEVPFSLNYADQHFLLLLSFSVFLSIILWYITCLHLAA